MLHITPDGTADSCEVCGSTTPPIYEGVCKECLLEAKKMLNDYTAEIDILPLN